MVSRRHPMRLIFALTLVAAISLCGQAWAANAYLRLAPAFETCSVDVTGAGLGPNQLRLQYRELGSEAWLPAMPLVNSSTDATPRCSLFNLQPGRDYEVWCLDQLGQVLATGIFRTLSEDVPVARTIRLAAVNPDGEPYLIDQSGTPDGWIRYVGEDGYAIDGRDLDPEALLLEDVRYVIVENLTVRGGDRHGIRVLRSQHVRIVNCDISGFGRVGEPDPSRGPGYFETDTGKAINWDAGVYIQDSGDMLIARNYIHDPRGTANSWVTGHPLGPNGVFVKATGGVVIRHNDMVGSHNHRWNDVIEGYGNRNQDGGFNRDATIAGNFLAIANDDGIELDGGQRNIRFMYNRIDATLCGISTAPNQVGPSYLIGNLVHALGDERGMGSAAVKNGGGPSYSHGLTYFYHNTFYTRGNGITGVGFGKDKDRQFFRGISRNNILAVSGSGINHRYAQRFGDYAYDLYSTPTGQPGTWSLGGAEPPRQGIQADARFVATGAADFRLRPDSPAIAAGAYIPGLHSPGAQPDLGALPAGAVGFLPRRPVGFSASSYHLSLESDGSRTDSRTVTLSAWPDLTEPVSFTVRQGDDMQWLRVSPASGVIVPGQSLAITVTLDVSGLDSVPLRLGAILLRRPDGMSLPISVTARQPIAQFERYAEAEDLDGADAFSTDAHDGSAHGVALHFTPETANGQGAVTLDVEVPVAGDYYLYYRIKCPEPIPMHDSLWVSVNGAERLRCAASGSANWAWLPYSQNGGAVSLQAGSNTITFSPREGIYLDAVVLRASPLPLYLEPNQETPEQ